ncbi:MAG TPA: zinc ribbon domain-containing protein [Methanomassiliicoccales archaeon]|nr:zinc ribbon domain-containing protein [Methanomassiliicoccales archaeon]
MADTKQPSLNFLSKMRGTRQGIILGILVTFVASYFVLVYLGLSFCLAPAIIALMMYFVPRWFGLTNRKYHAVFGVVFLIAIGLMLGATVYYGDTGLKAAPVDSSDKVLTAGTVTPFNGPAGGVYNYSVVVAGGNTTPILKLHVVDTWSLEDTAKNMTTFVPVDATHNRFYLQSTASANSIYYYYFEYTTPGASPTTVTAGYGAGPITASNGDIFAHDMTVWTGYVLYLVGLLFFMLLILTWWMDSSRKKFEAKQRNLPPKVTGDKPGKFVCSECGAEVPADATQCARCGERFEETDKPKEATAAAPKSAEEFVCSECGKTVKATDNKCWNCGKEFEN